MPSCNWTAWLPRFQPAAEAMAAGDVSAINPYLKALDRLDRYQTVASANQVYDDEARQKLMDKVNRMAENFGINEDFAAAVEAHLKAIRETPADEPSETEEQDGILRIRPNARASPTRLRRRLRRFRRRPLGFLYLNEL